MKAYLLAAGFATRMFPLTESVAKPLLEVAGKPILSHILARVEALPGLSEIIVIGNHRFADSLLAWSRSLTCPVPLRVLDDGANHVDERLGAIGDLAFALEAAPNGGEDLLVVAGDNLLDFDLEPLQRAFEAEGKPLLITRQVEHAGGPSPYNDVDVDDRGQVRSFREKPERPSGNLSAIALYFLTPETDELLGRYLAEGGNPDAPGHFIAWLVSRREVAARPMPGGWFDIGDLALLEEARRRFPAPNKTNA